MEKDKIIQILNEWNFWTKDLECGIIREKYLQQIDELKNTGQITIITGIRRSGKSTILKQYIKKHIEKGEDRKNFLYINFEEQLFTEEFSLKFLQEAYQAYLEIIQPTSKPYIILDEIQQIPEWEKFARSIHEKNEAFLFISGSTAKLSTKEYGTKLTGRHADLKIYPLNFKEFLEFKNLKIKTKIDLLSNKTKIKQLLREYLEFGGLPLIALTDKKKELLNAYFDDIITKDVIERFHVKKTSQLKTLAKFYLTNNSSLISFRKIKNFININLDTTERFTEYLKEVYLLNLINKYTPSLKAQEKNPKKIFITDLGIRNVIAFKFMEDMGKLYENAVYLKLTGKEVYYYQNKRECDFLVKEQNKITQAIQVCYQLTPENKKREMDGLLEAIKKFKPKQALIITEDEESTEKHQGKTIKITPLWKWLLQ
jgi:predicted AAA+ superfamily ATPase